MKKTAEGKLKNSGSAGIRMNNKIFGFVCCFFLLLYAFIMGGMILWAFINSFRYFIDFVDNVQSLQNPWTLPNPWQFDNYLVAFQEFGFITRTGRAVLIEQMIIYSLLYAVGAAFFYTLTMCVTAYATSRFNFKFSKIVFAVALIAMVMPIVGNLPAEIRMAQRLGIFDSIWGLWIMRANFLGLFYFVFFAQFRAIPRALTEAAQVDGASNLRIMTRIMLPLISKTFATVMLITFIQFWNDYQVPSVYLLSQPTLAYGLFRFMVAERDPIGTIPMNLAASMIIFVPIFIVFLATHKKLIGNMTMGSVKG